MTRKTLLTCRHCHHHYEPWEGAYSLEGIGRTQTFCTLVCLRLYIEGGGS
jgi:hypothetical protein